METFSLKLCQFLSYLAPGFEGHSVYVHGLGRNGKERINVVCRVGELQWLGYAEKDIICPAWQVEDVLRNLKSIALKQIWTPEKYMQVGTTIALYLYEFPDTAYQKIEEYLWSILK